MFYMYSARYWESMILLMQATQDLYELKEFCEVIFGHSPAVVLFS